MRKSRTQEQTDHFIHILTTAESLKNAAKLWGRGGYLPLESNVSH